jgi:hypothetical protein
MPRYLVERVFTRGLSILINGEGTEGVEWCGGRHPRPGRDLGAVVCGGGQAQDLLHLRQAGPGGLRVVAADNGLQVEVRVLTRTSTGARERGEW